MTHSERVSLVDKNNSDISIARQSELLDISRTSFYYQPRINEQDIETMNLIDQIYTKRPFYGSRRIKYDLEDYNIFICREHVQRLMRIMGLEAIYPKKSRNTSVSDDQHPKYPYLLTNLRIIRPNQVHSTDITYVKLENGFVYLVALLDWFSRYALAWELSPSLEDDFCITALNRSLRIAVPEIHNSDQGRQFTGKGYTDILKQHEIKISMDGRGRCMDNIFTERLWRTVKYEDIYLKSYRNISQAKNGLTEYFNFYNNERKHQSLNYKTPAEIFFSRR